MGKEASGVWGQLSDGESEGKLLWEPPKLIFRGAVRGIYQGHALRGVRAEGDDLVLSDGTRFTLDPGQAEKWALAILNPPSRLDKLGVKPGMTVVVDGVEDPEFLAELETRVEPTEADEGIDLLFLAADDLADLERMEDWKGALAAKGAIWVVSRKGKGAPLKDTDVLGAARGMGFSDTKVCAFSATHTALRFVARKGG
ncbi:MAG TPA: DUF3052 domain-containing protein [Caulobacter sp.]|nr:DUF3052 domain-containing protein [Caulobacter sp.]